MYAELQNELEACQEYARELEVEEDAKLRDQDLEDVTTYKRNQAENKRQVDRLQRMYDGR
jgi:hypothetical protein